MPNPILKIKWLGLGSLPNVVTQIGPIASATWYWLYLGDCIKKNKSK